MRGEGEGEGEALMQLICSFLSVLITSFLQESGPHPARLWCPDDDYRLNASITDVGM